jgi:hypothetical protein
MANTNFYFPPPSELLVCFQPHRQKVMLGQKSIYETFLATPLSTSIYLALTIQYVYTEVAPAAGNTVKVRHPN